MNLATKKAKKTLTKFTDSFKAEINVFQKFVIIHKYIDFLKTSALTKKILQKIFDDTAATIDNTYYELTNKKERSRICGKNFWIYYTDLERIYDIMGEFKTKKPSEKIEFDKIYLDFYEPYSEEILEFSIKVVNGYIFNYLDRELFLNSKPRDNKTWFDTARSVLNIEGYKIKIASQNKETNAHKILKHIFTDNRDNMDDSFFFSEIAEDVFEDLEYKEDKNSWQRYYDTCKRINEKIRDKTKNVVNNFLIFNSGQKGYLKINTKYL